jgi:hypothetical protein
VGICTHKFWEYLELTVRLEKRGEVGQGKRLVLSQELWMTSDSTSSRGVACSVFWEKHFC